MNDLIREGVIREMEYGANLAYVLEDSGDFLPTEYKVLLSQGEDGFVKCMKMLYNGKIQIFYMTEPYRTLASLLPYMDSKSFRSCTAEVLSAIVNVKRNGFISSRNINLSLDRIYIDQATLKAHFIYLPSRRPFFQTESDAENELRANLVRAIRGFSPMVFAGLESLADSLGSGVLAVEDLPERVNARKTETKLRLVPVGTPGLPEICVTKDSFLLGSSTTGVDGVVMYNRAVSRVHCRIERWNGQYSVLDLKSTNGTFVNQMRLEPNRPCLLKNGDVLRLANCSFMVEIS